MKDQSQQTPAANPLPRSNVGGSDPNGQLNGFNSMFGSGNTAPSAQAPGSANDLMGTMSSMQGAANQSGGGQGNYDPSGALSSLSGILGGGGSNQATLGGANSASPGFNQASLGAGAGSAGSTNMDAQRASMGSLMSGNGSNSVALGGMAGIGNPGMSSGPLVAGSGGPSGSVGTTTDMSSPQKAYSQTPPIQASTMPQGDGTSGTGSSANQTAPNTSLQSGYTGATGSPTAIADPRQVQALASDPSTWAGTPIPGSAPASAAANPSGSASASAGASPGTNPLSNEWGSVTGSVSPYGQIQNGLNTSNVPGLASGDALQGTMQQAQDAAYKNATGYLDPQWQNQQTTLQNQLANQGVMQNSEAWNKAMDDFGRQKQFAYQQAQSNAVNQGLTAQGQLFNQGLQANQNAFGQDLSAGQFGNAAQQQGYQQNLSNANFANSAQNQIATQGLQNRQIASQLEGQRYAANAAGASAGASAAASMANVQAQIQAQQQQNQFNNSLSLRNQGINELLLQQQNPLQMINGLSGGQGVSQPNFTSAPGTNVGGTDIMSAIQNAYQGQMGGYNAQTGANNSNNAAMASIIAAMICDRRLKKNIRKIGVLSSGCALYEFEYLWGEKAVGPMADEVELVRPDAVFTLSTGHKVVDVARL